MTKYILDKYDFRKFLLEELKDTRQEELIFWKKTIPMPVDLIYSIFDRKDELLGKYLDHIGAAYLFAWSMKSTGMSWRGQLDLQPCKDNHSREEYLTTMFQINLEKSGVTQLLVKMAEMLQLKDYRPNAFRLFKAICHEGRKYKRLYIPLPFRNLINKRFPELLQSICISNWDMFSNVVADELKVYRMGFADAFSGIFNKLIDFAINPHENNISPSKATLVQRQTQEEQNHFIYGDIIDGSLWEPRFTNGAGSFILNRNHPFSKKLKECGNDAEKLVNELIGAIAKIEDETLKDAFRKNIEVLRHEISRELRVRMEK